MPVVQKPHKNQLEIRLTENVVFLRAGDATGRQRTISADAPPGMLRGLLILTLVKPTKISSIEISLIGKTATAWPEGMVTARRMELTEEHIVYSQSTVFFDAATNISHNRRTASVGPGLALDHDEDDHSEASYEPRRESSSASRGDHQTRRGRDPRPPVSRLMAAQPRRNMSVDQTNYQRSFVSHNINGAEQPSPSPPYMPSPQYSPQLTPASSSSNQHRLPPMSPQRSLDDLRYSTDVDHSVSSHVINRSRSRPGHSSSSSIMSPLEITSHLATSDLHSPHRTPHEEEFQVGSSNTSPVHQRQASTHFDHDDGGRGRKKRNFGFANALLDAVKDRVRSRSPIVERDIDLTPLRGAPRGRTLDKGKHKDDSPHHSVDGREEDVKDSSGRWKEFRKGVYTYPISFAIPASSPPSLHCDNATVSWEVKAYAHRPGTFTAKLSAAQDVTVVATPGEDETEDTDSILVERQWDTQMQYMILVSGRSFRIGGVMPINIVFMPLTKMKIYRISVIIEERVDYWTHFRTIAYTDPVTRVVLLSLKQPNKDDGPILPLLSDDPEAFRRSPLYELLEPSQDPSDLASTFMGPGPWNITKDMRLPEPTENLHFTNKNKMSNISVNHTLKVIFRVERGDDQALDAAGKRKMFDIVVQSPIHILSPLCNPEYTSLPPYSQVLESITATGNSNGMTTLQNCSYLSPSSYATYPTSRSLSRVPSQQSWSTTYDQNPTPLTSPPLSRQHSLLDRSSRFERLVTGQESTEGELPPSYDASVGA